MSGQLLLFEERVQSAEIEPRVLDLTAYSAAIARLESAFLAAPSYDAALELSKQILHSAIDHADPNVGIVVSCSWGKDSTVVVGLLADVLLERKATKRSLPSVFVVTADTANEFPDMAVRVESEMSAVKKWADREGFDLATAITRPAAKNQLFAELIGAGRPLPTYQKADRAESSSWCVNRLKVGPINHSIEIAKGRGKPLLHLLGTRMDESERRRASVEFHGRGMPFALTRTSVDADAAKAPVPDLTRVGVCPIVHFTHEHLTQYLRQNMAPWNPWSYELLKEIYRRGSLEDDENGAGECRITFTKDGGVSNTCSDLSGSRFGCVTCAVSSANRSLIAYAKRDPRYLWINRVHKYIVGGMKLHRRRMKDLRDHGFDQTTCFPKNQTFEWRYRLAMFVYRAQFESGFTLLTPEVERAIEAWWQRSGIFTVRMSDAKEDAIQWMRTGRVLMRWKAMSHNFASLSQTLGEGVPGCVYAHLLDGDMTPVSRVNLLPMAGRNSGFFPSARAYVFRDPVRGGFVTVLTDAPGDIGRRLNTDAASGFELFSLELDHVRDLTRWERILMRGRMIFYRHTVEGTQATIERLRLESNADNLSKRDRANAPTKTQAAEDLRQILLANAERFHPCGEKEFIDALDEGHFIASLRGRISQEDFAHLYRLIETAAGLSDVLTERHEFIVRSIKRENRGLLDKIRGNNFGGEATSRATIVARVAQEWDLNKDLESFLTFVDLMREIALVIFRGGANTELVNRLATISRHARFDEEYARRAMMDVLAALDVSNPVEAAA